jgi:hypothetical protein
MSLDCLKKRPLIFAKNKKGHIPEQLRTWSSKVPQRFEVILKKTLSGLSVFGLEILRKIFHTLF